MACQWLTDHCRSESSLIFYSQNILIPFIKFFNTFCITSTERQNTTVNKQLTCRDGWFFLERGFFKVIDMFTKNMSKKNRQILLSTFWLLFFIARGSTIGKVMYFDGKLHDPHQWVIWRWIKFRSTWFYISHLVSDFRKIIFLSLLNTICSGNKLVVVWFVVVMLFSLN